MTNFYICEESGPCHTMPICMRCLIFCLFLCLPLKVHSEIVTFTPPVGWKQAQEDKMPKNLEVLVVGKGEYAFPPSINLAAEAYKGSLKDYLVLVRKINEAEGTEWKNLGFVTTEAGSAALSQTELQTEHGKVRMLHLILKRDQTIYVLTAASLAKEFPKFYVEFFNSLRSIQIQGAP